MHDHPLTVDDAFAEALLRGHVLTRFERDLVYGWEVASCRVCSMRIYRYRDGAIEGAPLHVECDTGIAVRPHEH